MSKLDAIGVFIVFLIALFIVLGYYSIGESEMAANISNFFMRMPGQ